MDYLVMECHRGYAVVLDNAGHFIKVANLSYTVGQTVHSVIEMERPESVIDFSTYKKQFISIASAAACLCLLILSAWQFLFISYGTVRMQINPDVEISVNRLDYVIAIEGRNEDGKALIEGYKYSFKKLTTVSNELTDLAVAGGYLSDGGKVRVTVSSSHEKWQTKTESTLITELKLHLGDSIIVTTEEDDSSPEETAPAAVAPIAPAVTEPVVTETQPVQSEAPIHSSSVPVNDDNDDLDDGPDDDVNDFDDGADSFDDGAGDFDDGVDDLDDAGAGSFDDNVAGNFDDGAGDFDDGVDDLDDGEAGNPDEGADDLDDDDQIDD